MKQRDIPFLPSRLLGFAMASEAGRSVSKENNSLRAEQWPQNPRRKLPPKKQKFRFWRPDGNSIESINLPVPRSTEILFGLWNVRYKGQSEINSSTFGHVTLFFFFTVIVTEMFHCPPVKRLCVTLFPLFRTPRLPHTSSSSAWQRRNATEDSGRWRRCRPFCPTPRSSKSTNAPADDDGPSGDDARDAGAHQTDGRWRPTAWPSPPTTCPFFFPLACRVPSLGQQKRIIPLISISLSMIRIRRRIGNEPDQLRQR